MPSTPATGAPVEARVIGRDACVYGFPLVDNYRIQHSYFVDRAGPEFKVPWNTLFNNARVYTPDDKAIQTPNSDTPYSYVGADLRAEPLVLTVTPLGTGEARTSLRFFTVLNFLLQFCPTHASETGLMVSANVNRYLINSPMLPRLTRDADGGITLRVQHASPGPDAESNWLPAPSGPFFCVLRSYWPKPEALDGRWKTPQMRQAH